MKWYSLLAFGIIILLFQDFTYFFVDSNGEMNSNKESISQIEQGGDPSLLLKATATGSASCDTQAYLYGTSFDGFKFVQNKENSLYAVDTQQGVMLLRKNETGSLFYKLDQDDEPAEIKRVLSGCEKSPVTPQQTDLHFVMLKN